MGLDLFFLKAVATELRPVLDIELDDFGKVPGHPELFEETITDISLLPLNLPFYLVLNDFHVWEQTFAKRGLLFEDYRWIGYDSGHEFENNKTKQKILFLDEECVMEKRPTPTLMTKRVFYDRISYNGGVEFTEEACVLRFDTSLLDLMDEILHGNGYISPEFFLQKVLPIVNEKYSPQTALKWFNAYKEHKDKMDLVLVAY